MRESGGEPPHSRTLREVRNKSEPPHVGSYAAKSGGAQGEPRGVAGASRTGSHWQAGDAEKFKE
jgi:hypothetical protein